jgi:hypothetical protein
MTKVQRKRAKKVKENIKEMLQKMDVMILHDEDFIDNGVLRSIKGGTLHQL